MAAYSLLPTQVPMYPQDTTWPCALRWCLAVMDPGDQDIAFTASLLSFAAEKGLSERQKKYARRVVDRVVALHAAQHLQFQQVADTSNVVALRPSSTSGDRA